MKHCCNYIHELDWNESIPFFVACLSILGSVLIWALSEHGKRRQEMYKRKEERYAILIESLKGFYVNSQDKVLKDSFLAQLNLCWLYCPDVVIQKGNAFVIMVDMKQDHSDYDKEKALGEFILEIRKDLIKNKIFQNTRLKSSDFRIFSAT